jgi:SAM-dependent methyltransferase
MTTSNVCEPDALSLFTRNYPTDVRLVRLVRYPQGIRGFFLRSSLLKDRLRVLDAGCGTGVVTLALHDALVRRRFKLGTFHAFDLTPAMLERFRDALHGRGLLSRPERRTFWTWTACRAPGRITI